jgi:hypothetical protein
MYRPNAFMDMLRIVLNPSMLQQNVGLLFQLHPLLQFVSSKQHNSALTITPHTGLNVVLLRQKPLLEQRDILSDITANKLGLIL